MKHRKPTFSSLFSLILMSLFTLALACKSQENITSSPENQPDKPKHTVQTRKARDPLLYLEGQLCQHLRVIFEDSQGGLWLGTNVYGLMHFDGDSLRYLSREDGFSGGRVTGIQEDGAGNLWIANSLGLYRFDGTFFTLFDERDGLQNPEIWSLFLDDEGIFWIGNNQGLSRFDGQHFENISIPKPEISAPNTVYSPDRITSIVEDEQGNLWLGTDGYGICRYDGANFTHFTKAEGLCDNTISELMVDSRGNLWIGTFFGGVSKFDGETFSNYTADSLISGVEVGGFFEDANGDIWFGAENHGVYRYNGSSFQHYHQQEGLNGIVIDIFRDSKNRFWFGGWGGLFRFDGKSFLSVREKGPWD